MKKLFFLALLPLLVMHGRAQTIYVEVVPDTIVHDYFLPYHFHLDSNGTEDFSLESFCFGFDQFHSKSCYAYFNFTGDSLNAAACANTGELLVMNANDVIGATTVPLWVNRHSTSGKSLANSSFNQTTGNSSFGGPWVNVNDKFLGMRFIINGQLHYGWIRMTNVATGFEMKTIIKDWAYNPVADSSIVAGDGWLAGMVSGSFEPITVSVVNNALSVHFPTTEPATVTIYDSMGQLITRREKYSGEEAVELTGLASGIYVIVAEQSGRSFSEKFLVQ